MCILPPTAWTSFNLTICLFVLLLNVIQIQSLFFQSQPSVETSTQAVQNATLTNLNEIDQPVYSLLESSNNQFKNLLFGNISTRYGVANSQRSHLRSYNNPFSHLGLGSSYLDSDVFQSFDTDPTNALRTFLISPVTSGSLFRSNAIQLAGSYLSYMGRVRVAASEFRWGSICGDGWDTKDATVVCRQLGFQIGGVVARPKLEFGQRTGPVVMSQVRCEGHENSLSECKALKWNGRNSLACPKQLSAAGVVCSCPIDVPSSVLARCYIFTTFPYDRYYCRYRCARGSVLVGDHRRYCNNRQQWTGTKPQCLKTSDQISCTQHRYPPTNLRRFFRRRNKTEAELCLSYGCCYNSTAPTSSSRCFLPVDSPCAKRPCLNGGTCRDRYGQPENYDCKCSPTHTGVNCEILRKWTCGVPAIPPETLSVRPQLRIVGGREAKRGSWPWIVQIRENGTQFCSGTLLSPYWIVTAAHCMSSKDIANGFNNSTKWMVVTGQHKRLGRDKASQASPIEYVMADAYSRPDIPRRDIALLKLRNPIRFDNFSAPICLPTSVNENPVSNTKCWVAGWGRISNTSEDTAPTLQQGDIPVLSNARCRQNNKPNRDYRLIGDNMICAGYQEGGVDACKGDSGGPLMCSREDGSWYLAGIISWGYDCAEPNTPGVYTRVSHYLDWIRNNMDAI